MNIITVHGFWDDEAGVWVASSEDVPGLATEADTMNLLVEKLKVMIPELLAANGYPGSEDVLFKLSAELTAIAHRHAH